MKAIWNAIAIVLLINLLVLVGAVLWLYAEDRLNDERVRQAAAIFQTTLSEDASTREALQRKLKEQESQAKEMGWLEEVSGGPVSVADRLARDRRTEELAALALERSRADREVWLKAMAHFQREVEVAEARVKAQREALQQVIDQQTAAGQSEGFRKAVQMYEQAPPKLAKQMLMELIQQQEMQQVVEYLAVMQPRKAADVLREFKAPPEVKIAAELIEGLRLRGVEVLNDALAAAGGAS